MGFSKAVVKHRKGILLLTLLLMIPSLFGMIGTRINYDMLDYLPEDIKRRVEGLRAQMKVMAEDLLDGYRISLYCGAVSSATSPDLSNTQTNLNCLIVALAHAKREYGSVVCMYNDSMHQEEQLRQYIEANMHRALAENEYQVYLQPKMNLRTGQIDSAEALVRWKTKERGLLFPDQFIPLF